MKLIFLGPQGSGKSTQAKKLAQELNVPHLEMGQLLRDKMQESDEDAQKIRAALKSGALVENEITIRTLNAKIAKPDFTNGFILDGYPRNEEQLQNLPEGIDKVIYINVPDSIAVGRLSKRAREDDTQEVIQKRLDIYHKETEPLLENFRQKGLLVEINGQASIEQVDTDIKKALNLTNVAN